MTVETIDITPTLRVRIEIDEDATNPRSEYDNLGRIAYSSRSREMLGDEPCSLDELNYIRDRIESGALVGLPVFAYIHSGVVIKAAETNPFHCPWDSGQSGYIYMTKEAAIKEWGKKVMTPRVRQKALDYLKGEVQTFSEYLGGHCYGYVVERLHLDEDGDTVSTEELDACWGFIGDLSYVVQEATAAAEHFKETQHVVA